MDKMLNAKGVMEFLGCGRTTVYQLLRRADFPTTRVGKKMLVSQEALAEWCAKGGTADRDNAGAASRR